MNKTVVKTPVDFRERMQSYKRSIDQNIEAYCRQVNQSTLQTYGEHSQLVTQAYTDILQRGGKRIRGILTMVGYEMCGGSNQEMIIQAARAIEMMHAYMLIIDDIQDRAVLRRGGPSTHKLLEARHNEQKWHGNPQHSGISLALNAALLGSHGAELVFSNLGVSDELRIKALNIMNHTMVVTAHGQTHDIINEIADDVSVADIENVLQWKTAHYSVLNPIHMGMVLAGAPCEDTNAITQYALQVGKAFQITDDLLVVTDHGESGKNSIDDIREGKQTLLTVHALQKAKAVDRKFLRAALGNQDLSSADFERCQQIFFDSGAVDYARGVAEQHIFVARQSLREHADRWDVLSVAFLDDLAQYLLNRAN